jgi:hypothetical protein
MLREMADVATCTPAWPILRPAHTLSLAAANTRLRLFLMGETCPIAREHSSAASEFGVDQLASALCGLACPQVGGTK